MSQREGSGGEGSGGDGRGGGEWRHAYVKVDDVIVHSWFVLL